METGNVQADLERLAGFVAIIMSSPLRRGSGGDGKICDGRSTTGNVLELVERSSVALPILEVDNRHVFGSRGYGLTREQTDSRYNSETAQARSQKTLERSCRRWSSEV